MTKVRNLEGEEKLQKAVKGDQRYRMEHTTLCLYLCLGAMEGGVVSEDSSAFEDQIVRGQGGQ